MINLVWFVSLSQLIVCFGIAIMSDNSISVHGLWIPTEGEKGILTKAFIEYLDSFTIHDATTDTFRPVICSVCNSIPLELQWSCFVSAVEMEKLLRRCNMEAASMSALYPASLLSQYSVNHKDLKSFVLSPETYVNSQNDVLVCKQCVSQLRYSSEKTLPSISAKCRYC